MITSVNKKINPEYLKLYAAVQEYMTTHDSNGAKVGDEDYVGPTMMAPPEVQEGEETPLLITSLNDLFSYMKELRALKPQYTRLPLDEPYFEINANTRMIDIPEGFSKTGAFSVEGDEIAESIYFKINRFYDHMDLATQDIFIQYTNAKGEQSASVPPVVDIESEPGFIIFEWPISSKVTAAAGNVQFSVRFFTYDNTELDEEGRGGKIVYSLSTLPANIQVKASQNFDLIHIEEEDTSLREDNTSLMKNRLLNSPIYGGDETVVAQKPVFWKEFSLPTEMNLGVDSQGFTTETVYFPVQAYSEEGVVTYSWMHDSMKDGMESKLTMLEVDTKGKTPDVGKVYYTAKLAEDGRITGYLMAGSIIEFAEGVKYYERVSMGTIDSVGTYYVIATNRVKNATATSQTPVVIEDGEEIAAVCVVPEAKDPVMKDISKKLILSFDDDTDLFSGLLADDSTSPDKEGKLTYQWYHSFDGATFTAIEGATNSSYTIQGASSTEVELENTFNEGKEEDDPTRLDIIVDVDSDKTEAGKLEDGDSDPLENMTSTGNGKVGTDEEGNEVIFLPKLEKVEDVFYNSGDGYYMVKVTNNLNKTSKELSSNVCRVTHSAIKPAVVTKVGKREATGRVRVDSRIALDPNKGLKIEATIPEWAGENRTAEDSITYQWFRYSNVTQTQEQLDDDGYLADDGKYIVDNDYRLKGQTDDTLVLTEADLAKGSIYFCRAVNTYNGTKAMRCSKFFEISTITE